MRILSLLCVATGFAVAVVSPPVLAKLAAEESRSYYDKAVEESKQGNLRNALIELKNALQVDPTNAEARLLLGEVYLALGDGVAAEKELRAAERYGIVESRTVVELGHALILQDRFADLLRTIDPEGYSPDVAFEVRLLRADAQAGLGQFAEAREAYEGARAVDPKNARIPLGLARIDLLQRNFDAVEAHAAEALTLVPDLAEATLLRAEARRQKGDAEVAIVFYRSILDGRPAPYQITARAHLGVTASLMALDRDSEAEQEIATFRSILPYSPLGPYLAAMIKLRARDFVAARQILEGSAPLLDQFAPAGFLFGIVYFQVGELEWARARLSPHLAAHPENLPARKLLGATLLRLGAVSEAIPVLEPALKQAPEDLQVLLQLGYAYTRAGRAAEATELLKRAAEVAPEDPRVLSQLAISYVATGQGKEALAALDATLDLGADASATGYALAFVHLRTGAYDAALKVAQNLREHLPNDAVAANLEGAAYAALGRKDDARRTFEDALKIQPAFHEARANLAALKSQAGDVSGAESDYSKILEADEKNVPALVGMAGIARHRGDTAGTRAWLVKAVAADPRAIKPGMALAEDYTAAGELPAALDLMNSLALHHPTNPQVLFTLGRLQSHAGRFQDAVNTYKRLMDATKGATESRTLLAEAYLAAGEINSARSVLEESIRDNPDHRPTVEALVGLVSKMEGLEAGFTYAERLTKRFPEAAWSSQLIGDLHWRAGRVEEAIAEYERGWSRKPSATLAVALSQARMQLPKQHVDEGKVLAPLQQWLEGHPADDSVRLVLAETQLKIGDLTGSIKEYEALKPTEGDNPNVWNNLAWLYQQVNDERAVEHGERALELAPHQPEIMDTLGWILLARGQVDRAVTLLQDAHRSAPDNTEIAFHFAVSLHESGDDTGARRTLESLLAKDEPFTEKADAVELLSRLSP